MTGSAKQSRYKYLESWIASSLTLLAMTATSRCAVADRRLERQRGIPWKEDPGVLRDFGNKRVDQRPPHRFCINRCEMRLGNHLAHQPPGLAGVDEIIDDQ